MINNQTEGYHLSTFQNLQYSDTYNQVKDALNMANPICIKYSDSSLKGTNCFKIDMGDRPCINQFYTWFQVSDYCNFLNNERWKPYETYSKHYYLFHMRTLFQNGANAISEMDNIIYKFLSKRSKFCVVRIIRFCSNFANFW